MTDSAAPASLAADPQCRALLAALGLPAGLPAPGWRLTPQPAGGWMLLADAPPDGTGQPCAGGDRFGVLHWAARWRGPHLAEAWFRLPGPGWLELRPRTEHHALWGEADALWHHAQGPRAGSGRLVGRLPALSYSALRHLPPVDRPDALPPGAGGAVLNFLALLLRSQGAPAVAYRGPYPTPALFASLSRSFAPEPPAQDALPAFTQDATALAFRGELATNSVRWRPAPFAPLRPRPDLLLELRDGVERAWLRDVPFVPAPQAPGGAARPALPAGERLWLEAGRQGPELALGLVLLGRPYARFLRLSPDGAVRQAAALEDDPPPDAILPALDARWREVLSAWATRHAHAGLAAEVAALAPALPLHWAPLALRMAALQGPGLRLQVALAAAYRQRRAEPADAEDAVGLAMMLISDALEAATPLLLRQAQRSLAERVLSQDAPPEPAALLRAGQAAQSRAHATLEEALPRLLQALLRGEALPEPPARED